MPAQKQTTKAPEIKNGQQVKKEQDAAKQKYAPIVLEIAERTGFHAHELVHETRNAKQTDPNTGHEYYEKVDVVFPKYGARLRRFHEDHEDYNGEVWLKRRFTEKKNPAQFVVAEAEVKTRRGLFQAVGTASTTRDTHANSQKTLMEKAETRAKSRVLRDAGYGVEFDDGEGLLMELEAQEAAEQPAAPRGAAVILTATPREGDDFTEPQRKHLTENGFTREDDQDKEVWSGTFSAGRAAHIEGKVRYAQVTSEPAGGEQGE